LGGLGSGRHWLRKRTTVEECLTLDINSLIRGGLLHRSFGEVRWYRGGVETDSITYSLKERESVHVLTLHSPLNQDISLVTRNCLGEGNGTGSPALTANGELGDSISPQGRVISFAGGAMISPT